MAKMTRQDWKQAGLYAVLLTLFTLIPYGVGLWRANDDWAFGGFVFALDDANSYAAKIRHGFRGEWAFRLFYTTEPHEGVFGIYLHYMALGNLLSLILPQDSPDLPAATIITYNLWRVAACVGMSLAVYAFAAQYLKSRTNRGLAVLLATLGGGMGWLVILMGQSRWFGDLPLEFYNPEGFGFLAVYGLPHIATSRAAMLVGFLALFAALRTRRPMYAIFAGLCWLFGGVMVALYLAVLYMVLAAWVGILSLRWRRIPWQIILWAGGAASISLPFFLYSAWILSSDDVLALWAEQNKLLSPPPLSYLLSYGLLGGFACVGIKWAWRKASQPDGAAHALLIGWLVVTPFLVYLPFDFQRRLSEGILTPLVILAVVGLRLSLRKRPRIRHGIIGLALLSSILFWAITLLAILLSPACYQKTCLFRQRPELSMMAWLAEEAPKDSVVLASFRTSNLLPVWVDVRTVIGHGPETINYEQKEAQVQQFYAGQITDEAEMALLDQHQVRYVLYGPLEQQLGTGQNWGEPFILLYNEQGYQIYEVAKQ